MHTQRQHESTHIHIKKYLYCFNVIIVGINVKISQQYKRTYLLTHAYSLHHHAMQIKTKNSFKLHSLAGIYITTVQHVRVTKIVKFIDISSL